MQDLTPTNFATKETYKGKFSSIMLAQVVNITGCEFFAGFKQWADAGYKVKKGAKGFQVAMPMTKKVEGENKAGETVTEKKLVFKGRTIFHACQVEPATPETPELMPRAIEMFDKICALAVEIKEARVSDTAKPAEKVVSLAQAVKAGNADEFLANSELNFRIV